MRDSSLGVACSGGAFFRPYPEALILTANPDELIGKLRRGARVIAEFHESEAEFIKTGATEAKLGPAGSLTIEMKAIPDRLSAMAGDVLQNLRAALDHEVCRMAAAAKGASWAGLNGCGFPLQRDPVKYAKVRKTLIGPLSDPVKELIDGFQLFCVPLDPEAGHLELLNELARLDRHRLLHLTAMQVTGFEPELVALAEIAGELIGEVTPATTHALRVRMKMRLAFRDAPAQAAPVGITLLTLATAVRRVLRRLREAEARDSSKAFGHPGQDP
jgi:hypothetical protein